MIKATLPVLFTAVFILAAAIPSAHAQPSQQSLIEAWEQIQRSDSETLAFEKVANRRYKFKTKRFPFDGEIRILKATVDESAAEYGDFGYITGVIEYDLVGLSEEVIKKYERSYESWQENNVLTFDKDTSAWLSHEQQRVKMSARVKELTRAQEQQKAAEAKAKNYSQWISLAVYWLPFILLIWFWVWIIRRTGIKRQREYMNQTTLHMQNVEELLERIAVAVESGQKTKE